jgi:hypothetical protein
MYACYLRSRIGRAAAGDDDDEDSNHKSFVIRTRLQSPSARYEVIMLNDIVNRTQCCAKPTTQPANKNVVV